MSVSRKKSTAKRPASGAKAAVRPPRKPAARESSADEDDGDEESSPHRPGMPPRPDQMNDEVVTFISAIEEYKRQHQRPFPNWSEILEVVKALGYVRKG